MIEVVVDEPLRAPFPWFGGKRKVADLVWSRLGDVQTYNEPFAGSLAVLLGRPHAPRVETVNDLDCYIANFWRAVERDPKGVAFWCDAPINEADLQARHRWLVTRGRRLAARCLRDPHYFNAKVAGWWVWGQCLWIGSGWCQALPSPRNPHGGSEQARRPRLTSNQGGAASGRHWQGGGESGGGSGVHAVGLVRPHLSGDSGASGMGINSVRVRAEGLYAYMQQLCARLRRVRVCCGDWSRVLTPSVTTYIGTCGVFLDPPYQHDMRERCYSEDHDISADVRAWALANGDSPDFRIALCGYEGEHEMPDSWECVPWKAHGGYSRTKRGVENRERERIWFSPHCLRPSEDLIAMMGSGQ